MGDILAALFLHPGITLAVLVVCIILLAVYIESTRRY